VGAEIVWEVPAAFPVLRKVPTVVPVSIFVMDALLSPDKEPPLTIAAILLTGAELITVIVPESVRLSFSVSEPNPASAADSVLP
jgi:hypothetical protein